MPKGGLRHWAAVRLSGFALATALLIAPQLAAAQSMVVDRGLPTANLNNAASPDRSNVMWVDDDGRPVGDDFTLPGTEAYTVTTIRVWAMSDTGLTLSGSPTGGTIEELSTSFTATAATYTNGNGYQGGSSGDYYDFYQIDFDVNIPLNGGDEFQFFVEGQSDFFLHASNASLSGSPQDGSNDRILLLEDDDTVTSFNTNAPGWDNKPSDINVQVLAQTQADAAATSIPTMSSLGLAGMALMLAGAGLFFMRGRRDI